MIELRAGSATCTVVPEAGGRVGSLVVDGVDVLAGGSDTDDDMLWGSFPMAPWAGRVRAGRFTHDGVEHRLPLSLPPNAAHGTTWRCPWRRTDDASDPAAAALTCPLDPPWPLGGRADQAITLGPAALHCTLAVTAADRPMPAEVGWHPWFATPGPISMLTTAMYERGPDMLPTGRLVTPSDPPWDDCFVTAPTAPVTFPVGRLAVTVSSDCDHLVVFDGLEIGIAVEPQSGPPDAFNLRPRVLRPGETLRRTMTISWRRDDA